MGFFSSTKLPQPPLPDITIHLKASPDHTFRPDDIVEGSIKFTPIVPIAPRALEVSLFGQSLVWYRTSQSYGESSIEYHHWRDNAPFFDVTANVIPELDSAPQILEVGETYTYPFEFRFPIGTGNNRAGQYKSDEDHRWTVSPHDLPRSFLHSSKYGSAEQPDYAKIIYGVRARLRCPGIGITQGNNIADFVVFETVQFAPLCTRPQTLELLFSVWRYPKNFPVQSSLLAGQSAPAIGFRQSLRDRFSSSTPRLELESLIELPEVLAAGAEFRFRATINIISKSDNVTHVPSIRFRVLKLSLKDYTYIRAPRDRDASTAYLDGRHRKNRCKNMPSPDAIFPPRGQENEVVHKESTQLNSLPNATTIELEEVLSGERKVMEQANTCEALFVGRVPGFTLPSFKSFAISRQYQIKVKLGIELAGKHFEHEAIGEVRRMEGAQE